MPPQRISADAPYARSQEMHHMHRLLERIGQYNKCNKKSRRLLLVHVDESVGYRSVGVYGTPSIVAESFSSGFLSGLLESSANFCHEEDSNYVPYIFSPNTEQLRSASKEMVEATAAEVLKSIGWPNLEFFSREQPTYWPSAVPFKPVYDGMLSKEQLLTVLSSFYDYHFGRILDLGLCVHPGVGSGDSYHQGGVCGEFAADLGSLVVSTTRARFTDHLMNVGSKGVGFQLAKAATPQWRKNQGSREKRTPTTRTVHKELTSLAHRNVYSQFVAENFSKVAGNFAERQKILAEMWRTCDQNAYRAQLDKKKQIEYRRICTRENATRMGPLEIQIDDVPRNCEDLVTNNYDGCAGNNDDGCAGVALVPEIVNRNEIKAFYYNDGGFTGELHLPSVGSFEEVTTSTTTSNFTGDVYTEAVLAPEVNGELTMRSVSTETLK